MKIELAYEIDDVTKLIRSQVIKSFPNLKKYDVEVKFHDFDYPPKFTVVAQEISSDVRTVMIVVGNVSPEAVFNTMLTTIKRLREKTGWSLVDCKNAVEAYLYHHGYSRDSLTGTWIAPPKEEKLGE